MNLDESRTAGYSTNSIYLQTMRMPVLNRRKLNGLTLVLAALFLLGPSFAIAGKGNGKGGGGGNGGGGDPPADPTPVRYQLSYLDAPAEWGPDWGTRAFDMNDAGTIVGEAFNDVTGESLAVLWFSNGAMLDLNVGATWTDLDGGSGDGYTAVIARNVNAYDQIVGTAVKPGVPERAFVYDVLSAQFLLLPELAFQTEVRHIDINDDGVVACQTRTGSTVDDWSSVVYAPPLYDPQLLNVVTPGGYWIRINNLGTVTDQQGQIFFAGAGYDYSQSIPLDLTSTHRFYGIQDSADVVCGVRIKPKKDSGMIRLDLDMASETRATKNGLWARDINELGDMVIFATHSGYRSSLYTDVDGLLPLDDLVVNPDAAWQQEGTFVMAVTNPTPTTDPESTGYGSICGRLDTRAFLLTPEPPANP